MARGKLKWYAAAVIAAACCAASTGCGKFDRSKIKLPEFSFITSENLHSVSCSGAGHIWISGNYGTVCYSGDRGLTWDMQTTGIPVHLLGSISFAGDTQGWAAGVAGTMIHTSDGGATWHRQNSGVERDLLDLFFLDNKRGWAVGEYGTIIHTDDGGASWRTQIEEQDALYNDVFFADARNGWVVGEFGTILHTSDGGATWIRQECRDIVPVVDETEWEKPQPALYGLYFADARRGWIVGMDGVILRTTDGGSNWSKLDSGTDLPLYSIDIEGTSGWIVGNKGVYLMSADGGMSWTVKEDALKTKFWLREIDFCDRQHGIIVGARGTIARSDDGGDTWEIVSGLRYDMEEFGLTDF